MGWSGLNKRRSAPRRGKPIRGIHLERPESKIPTASRWQKARNSRVAHQRLGKDRLEGSGDCGKGRNAQLRRLCRTRLVPTLSRTLSSFGGNAELFGRSNRGIVFRMCDFSDLHPLAVTRHVRNVEWNSIARFCRLKAHGQLLRIL
jgi:hypothetical protein